MDILLVTVFLVCLLVIAALVWALIRSYSTQSAIVPAEFLQKPRDRALSAPETMTRTGESATSGTSAPPGVPASRSALKPVGPPRAPAPYVRPTAVPPSGITVRNSSGENVYAIRLLSAASASTEIASAKKVARPALTNALSPLVQAFPNLALAAQAANGRLMEVVIQGNLVRATDGVGWRAFAMGSGGIKEQAILHTSSISTLANVALIWNVLSIAVGQKHLADISKSLRRIEQKLDAIVQFLEQERSAKIREYFQYIKDAADAAFHGEFSHSTRYQLEKVELELAVIQRHLYSSAKNVLGRSLDGGLCGSKKEYESSKARIDEIGDVAIELEICSEARIAGWFVASLHAGGGRLLERRFEGIQSAIRSLSDLSEDVHEVSTHDQEAMNAKLAFDVTVAERRQDLADRYAHTRGRFGEIQCEQDRVARQALKATETYKTPIKLLVDVRNGEINDVYSVNESK